MRTIVTSLILAFLATLAVAGDGTISNPDLADNASVALNKLQLIANNSIVGNKSGGVTNPYALNSSEATSILDAFTGDSGSGGVKGSVPAPSAGDAGLNKFLHANGGWSVISLSDYLYLPGRGTGGQTVTNPVTIDSTTANQTLFSLNPQSGSNWDFRVEGSLFRLDNGAASYLVMSSGYTNIGGTRTPLNQVEIQNAATNTNIVTGLTQNVANLPLLAIANNSATANNWSALTFVGSSTASTGIDGAVVGEHLVHTSGSETGRVSIGVKNAGVMGYPVTVHANSVVQLRGYTSAALTTDGSGSVVGVAPGTSGNVLTSNGSAWVSSAAPAGSLLSVSVKTANYTLTNSDDVILVNGSSPITISLHAVSGATSKAYRLKNIGSASVVAVTNGSDVFDRSSETYLELPPGGLPTSGVELIPDTGGSSWSIF